MYNTFQSTGLWMMITDDGGLKAGHSIMLFCNQSVLEQEKT
jgi:hypothetical protein